MAAVESALVPVDTEDTVDSIFAKVRSAGAASVQLLVPDDTAALQTPRGFERLRRRLEAEGITLLVISSDTQTLEAARRNQLVTMAVQGTRVQTPHSDADSAARRYATRVLPETPIDDRDAAFLDALDHVSEQGRYSNPPDEDAELYAALDDLSDTAQRHDSGRRARSADDDFAASLNEWSDLNADETIAAPPRRYSADDVDLSGDDLARQRGGRRTAAQRARADMRATPARGTTAGQRRASTARRVYGDELDAYPAPRRNWLRVLLPLAILVLVVLALAVWVMSNRTTVAVAPPATAASAHPFKGEIIALSPSGGSSTAVQAVPVAADAEATTTGTVQTETLSPATTAHGEVTIVNTIENPVPLPKGAEFIGKNANGEEVRFTLDADVTVPAAVTTTSLAGRSTTYGQINVTVTARSPGSASNVGENAIKQILISGQQPIVSDSSNFLIRHAAIGGGSEQPQRIVTQADVDVVLQQLLTTLYNNGVQQLRSKIDESKFAIDLTTVSPSVVELGDPKKYQQLIVVEPKIGQPVADPNNPVFTVTARDQFKALSTPSGQAVTRQLETVARDYFNERRDRPCKPSEIQAPRVEAIHWDGEKLSIDGVVNCQAPGGLPPETIAKVREAVKGQSREAAEASLRSLQQQGLIGAYQLPERSSFPQFDFLLNVVEGQPQVAEPQPTSEAP